MSKDMPAFPVANDAVCGVEIDKGNNPAGMTLQQYAAIKLRVPDSGEEWLDEMIKKSLWNEFAGKALGGLCANSTVELDGHVDKEYLHEVYSRHAAKMAEAMLSELEKRGK